MKFFITSDNKYIYREDEKSSLTKLVELNRSEYLILLYLYENQTNTVSRDDLIKKGWPGRVVSENSLNVAMMKLRRKIISMNEFALIETFLGEGYRLMPLNGFSLEVVPNINQIKRCDKTVEEHVSFLKTKPLLSFNYDKNNKQDRLSWLIVNGIHTIKSTVYKIYSYVSAKPRLQFLLGLLISMLVFVYFYSEAWSIFICKSETVCSDYIK